MSTEGTTRSGTGAPGSLDDLELLVDADSHVTESLDDILPYMDDRHRGIREMIELSDMPMSDVFSITAPTPIFAYNNQSDDVEVFGGEAGPAGKLEMMDEHGIDYSVINPTLTAVLNTVNNTRVAVALARAYNGYMLDNFVDADERLKVTVMVPPQKPSIAAEEIDRHAGERDVVGVFVPTAGLVPPPGHEMYDPIYEAAEDHDLPVVFHSNTGAVHRAFPVVHNWTESYALEHALMHPFTHMWYLASMVFEGVPVKFPELDFVFSEAGIGYVPYTLWRLDDHYLEMPHDVPALEKLPSEYVREQFHFSTQPLGHTARNGANIARMIEMIGPELVMYAADMPHPDFDLPGELFDRIRGGLDGETTAGVMGNTAAEVFGI